MRLMPSRYARPVAATVKRRASSLMHFGAPLKGLNLSTKLITGDPLSAPILDNWIIEESQVRCRPGVVMRLQEGAAKPIECLVPFYGAPDKLALATDGRLVGQDGTTIATGFTNNDWHWTAFSNLSAQDYTVMVNGHDGVWSWDGAAVVEETVTAPTGSPHIVPDHFNIVVSHMNRLWFADTANLAVYYLPLQQKSGEVKELPLNAVFRRGGSVRAVYTWTMDGGMGIDDRLVVFSSNGEAAIFAGIDPDTDLALVGVYRFDAPMSKHAVVQYGGDLYVLISTGLVPMSTLMRAEAEQLGKADRAVYSEFTKLSAPYRDRAGWGVLLDHTSGRIICNMPRGAPNSYSQAIRFMPNPTWATWSGLPARCWGWVDNRLFFGTDTGKVFEMSSEFYSDAGSPIEVDLQWAWSMFGTSNLKQFKMLKAYIQTDGNPRPRLDIRVEYDTSKPTNFPEVSRAPLGSTWDTATWDVDAWSNPVRVDTNWQGVSGMGVVAAPRLRASVLNCSFAINGVDVVFEEGAI